MARLRLLLVAIVATVLAVLLPTGMASAATSPVAGSCVEAGNSTTLSVAEHIGAEHPPGRPPTRLKVVLCDSPSAATTAGEYTFDEHAEHASAKTPTPGSSVTPVGLLRQSTVVHLSRVAAEDGAGGFGRLARARMDRTLNPDRGGSLGGFSGNTTAHGAIRIGEAGFDDIDVAIIRAGSKYEQADGAFAYVAQAGKDSYNLIIQNADGAIVTAHRGWPLSDVAGMARSNGWSGW